MSDPHNSVRLSGQIPEGSRDGSVFWGTLRHGWRMPCLWDSETDARTHCDPDERVAQFEIREIGAAPAIGPQETKENT